ncbi:MAG: lysophospholipid acyltransferase family protein [Oscillospiraceae bacterium]
MFVKRDDGLDKVFWPFHIIALVLAAVLTVCGNVRGWWIIPAFVGWWIGGFLAVLVLFYLVLLLLSFTVDTKKPAPEENHPFYRAIVVYVIGQLCRFARIRIHCKGTEKLPEGRFLLVSNHRAAYDPIATIWALRHRDIAVVAKPEIGRIILAGPMLYKANFLPINRQDPREAMKTINAAAKLLANDVVSVGIYPEGTRNKNPENGLLEFHNGVFKIAQKARVPLVVATITGAEDVMKNLPWRRTEVYLTICEVIPAEELIGSTAAVSERVQTIMEENLTGRVALLT